MYKPSPFPHRNPPHTSAREQMGKQNQSRLPVIQPKPAAAPQKPKQPLAPPVYRPQPTPKVLQRKTAVGQRPPATQPERKPASPPPHRPQSRPAPPQAKTHAFKTPVNSAPGVYRPQLRPGVLQAKEAGKEAGPGKQPPRNGPPSPLKRSAATPNPRAAAVIQRIQLGVDDLKQRLEARLASFRQQIEATVFNVAPSTNKDGLWGNNDWTSPDDIAVVQQWWLAKEPQQAKNTEVRNYSTRGPAAKTYSPVPVANFECMYNDGTKALSLNFHVRTMPLAPAYQPPPTVPAQHGWELQNGDWVQSTATKDVNRYVWGKGHEVIKNSPNRRGF